MGSEMDCGGGDFNDILAHEDKQVGIRRAEHSFFPFRNFIYEMGMGEIAFRARRWTWANNRQGEGFIEERLDWFLCLHNGWLIMIV